MKQRKWMDRIVRAADLQSEPIPGQPLVEILGQQRVLIEHHAGVIEYSREKIQVKMCYGFLCVCGQGLMLARMTAGQLIITGQIDSVSIVRR
jgi:sporulation protein YqfC